MRPFKWSKSNAVFVSEIDDQHKELFLGVEELRTALMAAAPLFQLQEVLHRLVACTEDHLAHEERLMRAGRYELFEWHKQQHDTVRKRLRKFVPLVEQGDQAAGAELIEFLVSWLRDHTALTDRMMGAFLRNYRRGLVS